MDGQSVLIVDSIPPFRRGLVEAAREAGFNADESEDLLSSIAGGHDPQLVVMAVRSASDLSVAEQAMRARPDFKLVAVLPDGSMDAYGDALAAGASAVITESMTAAEITDALKQALDEKTVLPTAVARRLAAGERDEKSELITSEERVWLRQLHRGSTVAELASITGCSEREMYRRLQTVYERLGVESRSQALVRASEWGLLT